MVVSDIEKSKKFYKETLGLESTFGEEIGGEEYSKVTGRKELRLKFAVLRIPDSDVIIELAQLINPKEKINNDFRHIAFKVDDVDAMYKKLKGRKVETVSEPVTITKSNPKINGKRFFYFKDFDGNLIELFNKREGLYSG